jgi:hypothetical protein
MFAVVSAEMLARKVAALPEIFNGNCGSLSVTIIGLATSGLSNVKINGVAVNRHAKNVSGLAISGLKSNLRIPIFACWSFFLSSTL